MWLKKNLSKRDVALVEKFRRLGMEVEVLDTVRVITGSIPMNDVPTATHQSAMRIFPRIQIPAFLRTHIDDSKSDLLKLWTKNLFVGKADSSKAQKLKGLYVNYMRSIAPETPMDGFLRLDVVVTYDWLKKHKKHENMKYVLRNTAPDIDNTVKLIMDSMEKAGLVINDSRFCRVVMEKRFGDNPGVQFRISRMNSFKMFDDPVEPVMEAVTPKKEIPSAFM